MSNNLMNKAVSSHNLNERSVGNKQYGINDFNAWSNSLFDEIDFSSVLDICCGTGDQIVKYAVKKGVNSIVGVDLSKDSLNIAQKRFLEMNSLSSLKLINVAMEDVFESPELKDEKFDLISCFYGLYYSRDVEKTLNEMINHLTDNGKILIVGPYGKNNSSLFNILNKHFELPELVSRSSGTFMENEVLEVLSKKLDTNIKTFVNKICYPNIDSILNYWRSSTFYKEDFDKDITKEFSDYFDLNDVFVVEKHVMAIIASKKKINKDTILVVAAHPDDEILGCGATMAKLINDGHDVYSLILGEGKTSRYSCNKTDFSQDLNVLNEETILANRVIGVKKIFNCNFPDNSFDSVPLLKIVKEIELVINKVKPKIIFTHHYGDLNIDHRITHQAVLTATRPMEDECVKEIYSFEIPSSTEWNSFNNKDIFIPNVFVDVSETINKKIEAMKEYESELKEYPHPRSLEYIKDLAKMNGARVGIGYSENFSLIRSIGKI